MDKITLLLTCLLLGGVTCVDLQQASEDLHENAFQNDANRDRRDVIEEEKYYSAQTDNRRLYQQNNNNQPWIPNPLPPEKEDPTTKISITNDLKDDIQTPHQTTERVTDKPTGRGARSNDNWIKLPYPGRDEVQRIHDEARLHDQARRHDVQRDDILTPPQPSGDLINSRMPRINFVTQNKQLETSETRNDKETIHRARKDEIRTEFVRPDEIDTSKYKPVYPRQAIYYPEESRRSYYDDRYYPVPEIGRRIPAYYDVYEPRRYNPYFVPRTDRFDEVYDIPRKPKRIIYYAHLPEVVRAPPSVDLRYRYSVDPYTRRPEDDIYARTGRYDYRFRNRYPYAPLRKDERNYRDLAGSGTTLKDKKIDDKVTPTPILPQKDDKFKTTPSIKPNRNLINSHQYHDSVDITYNDPMTHKGFQDNRQDENYLRYDEPIFQGAVEDPYQRKY